MYRAGKTEALSDDLQDAERRVEFIRNVCLNAGKKLTNPNAGHESAREKRLVSKYILFLFILNVLFNSVNTIHKPDSC